MRGVRTFSIPSCAALLWLSPLDAGAHAGVLDIVERAGSAEPSLALASTALRLAAVAVLLSAAALIVVWLRRGRAASLRESTPPPSQIDTEWLERHVFSLTPELVGALYDRRVAWPEVAALVARMSGESKLASRVATGARGWSNLELWLLVDRQELSGYERELVESLFFAERTTSGEALQEEYRGVGFDPADILRRHLKPSCDSLLGARPVFTWPLRIALGASALGFGVAIGLGTAGFVATCVAALLAALGPLSARHLATRWRRDPDRDTAEALPFAASAGASAIALAALVALWPALGPLEVAIFAGWSLVGSALAARVVASVESTRGLGLRRNLLAARLYFKSELERPEPRIQDDWLPYLIALDLKGAVDHWYLAFGRLETAARRERMAERQASSVAASPLEQAWTGGAGAYGGVGAAGAWIAATSSLEVAVPGRRRRRRRALGAELGYV
jgi:hypothetical protein